jgi:hypothetical protein
VTAAKDDDVDHRAALAAGQDGDAIDDCR